MYNGDTMSAPSESTRNIVAVLTSIPHGRVASYGLVARLAGFPNGARQVVRVLHARSDKDRLPWHRVLRADGSIALPPGDGFELQRALLEAEGVEVSPRGTVDLVRFGWKGSRAPSSSRKKT
jgi:methylated-DNA-protein-cysteine methyltransferase-like protein